MNFNPAFEKYQELYGFDDSVKPHWQMVPLSGEKKVYLANAEGMTVSAIDSKIIQISEIAENSNALSHKKRLFSIRGNSYGTTFLEVRKNNLPMTKLEVAVKKPKIVSLAFNFVSDKKDRTTRRNLSDVGEWMKQLNKLYTSQANISFIQRSAKNVKIDNDLGPDIDSIDAKGSDWEWNAIVSNRDKTADVNLFYVWKFVTSPEGKTHDLKGQTSGTDCIVSDEPLRPDDTDLIVIAHEIAHALGVPSYMHLNKKINRYRYLMFSRSTFAGKEIKKTEVNIMNL